MIDPHNKISVYLLLNSSMRRTYVCKPSTIPLRQLQHGLLALKHLVLGTRRYACLDRILHSHDHISLVQTFWIPGKLYSIISMPWGYATAASNLQDMLMFNFWYGYILSLFLCILGFKLLCCVIVLHLKAWQLALNSVARKSSTRFCFVLFSSLNTRDYPIKLLD